VRSSLRCVAAEETIGSPLPHLCRDWARPSHICAGTGIAPAMRLKRDRNQHKTKQTPAMPSATCRLAAAERAKVLTVLMDEHRWGEPSRLGSAPYSHCALRVLSGYSQGTLRVLSLCSQGTLRVLSGCSQGALRVLSGYPIGYRTARYSFGVPYRSRG
jgi:hypothetical protein